MQALGKHVLAEFYQCNKKILNNVSRIERLMIESAEKANATVISSSFHHFNPYGVSGVVVIAESHLAIHTWPEYGYASIDIYTCGDTLDPWVAYKFLKKHLQSQETSMMELKRGLFDAEHHMPHKPSQSAGVQSESL